jgi:hypothetical protein
MLRGITVTLYEQTQTGTDPFGAPVYAETPVTVDNVLVGEPLTEDLAAGSTFAAAGVTALHQKTIRFVLGIPKVDTHDWREKHVSWTDVYGREIHCKTFGEPITGIEENIPGPWHMKVRCEAYG